MDVQIIRVEPKRDLIEVTVELPASDRFTFRVRTKEEMEAKVRELVANLEARDQALTEIQPGPLALPQLEQPSDLALSVQEGTLEALRDELAVLVKEEALGVPQADVLTAKRAKYVAIRDGGTVKDSLSTKSHL